MMSFYCLVEGTICLDHIFFNSVHYFLLDIMYSIRNKFKFNKSTIASSSSSVDDHVMNLGDNYKEAHNVEVTNQGSTNEDNRENISSSQNLFQAKL